MEFSSIKFPNDFEYSSDKNTLPIEFYLDVLPRSKEIYLKLGYFSSKAIRLLAYGFAQFILNGGKIYIVTNHFLSENDSELIQTSDVSEWEYISNPNEWIRENLTSDEKHFIDCMKYLVAKGRLKLIPVMLLPNKMSHYKQGVFVDSVGNEIFMDGSCNFTASGLLENGETISVFRSWGSDFEKRKVEGKKRSISLISSKEDLKYKYLTEAQITNVLFDNTQHNTIEDLLTTESNLISQKIKKLKLNSRFEIQRKALDLIIKELNFTPRFPYTSGPREYQKTAYDNWKENHCNGIFAMATGTGKTITALNCLLKEYEDEQRYRAIILVPTKDLVEQWLKEVKAFNYKNVIVISSQNPKYKSELRELNTVIKYDQCHSFIIISTYTSFSKLVNEGGLKFGFESSVLIADEAHNMGSPTFKEILPQLKFNKKIGLSATIERYFDKSGDKLIQDFFESKPPYTFNYSMGLAIENGVLSRYLYYPKFVFLNNVEMEAYKRITDKISKAYGFQDSEASPGDAVKRLLLKRKRIIHKAESKLSGFKQTLETIKNKNDSMNFSFVYVPEGDDQDGENILDSFIYNFEEVFPQLKAYAFTGETNSREEILNNFESGFVNSLFSMKCLDEGVDLPRAETAIFCASTGNSRQFIQRRGRVLRKHPDKEIAKIYDLIVVPEPSLDQKVESFEKKILKDELTRVVYFAHLSSNYYEAMDACDLIAKKFDISVYALQDEIKEYL
jgi:superfamily II DNA or RNA helicase